MKNSIFKMLSGVRRRLLGLGQNPNQNRYEKSSGKGGYAGVRGAASNRQFPTLHTKIQKGFYDRHVLRVELGYLLGRGGMEFIRRGLRGELSAGEIVDSGLSAEGYTLALLAMRESERVYRSELVMRFEGRVR